MWIRCCLVLFAFLWLAAPVAAETRGYAITGDTSTRWSDWSPELPTDGTVMHPGAIVGTMILSDDGAGTVTLDDFEIRIRFHDYLHHTITNVIPGTTLVLDHDVRVFVDPGQTGAGSIRTSVDWGTLTNWTQTGRFNCDTQCPGGCGAATSCDTWWSISEGDNPPHPLSATAFDTDTWVFDSAANHLRIGRRCVGGSAAGSTCTVDADCPGTCTSGRADPGDSSEVPPTVPCACASTLEYIDHTIPAGNADPSASVRMRHSLDFRSNPVPALPLLGAAIAGAALLYAGVRAVRRRGR